jgi:hypothetical protein
MAERLTDRRLSDLQCLAPNPPVSREEVASLAREVERLRAEAREQAARWGRLPDPAPSSSTAPRADAIWTTTACPHCGGEVDGIRVLTEAELGRPAPQPSEPLAELAAMSPEEMSRRLREAFPAKPDPEFDRIRQQFVDGQHARANPLDFIGDLTTRPLPEWPAIDTTNPKIQPARQPSDTDTARWCIECGLNRVEDAGTKCDECRRGE